MRPDHRAVAFHRDRARRCRVMRDDQFTAGLMVGAEQQPGQRIGVDMALEPHGWPALHVEHDAVPVVSCGDDRLGADLVGQLEKLALIGLVQPGQQQPHLVGVHPAARDMPHVFGFPGQHRSTGKLAEIGACGDRADFCLPAIRERGVEVERRPVESQRHSSVYGNGTRKRAWERYGNTNQTRRQRTGGVARCRRVIPAETYR